jgi:hypothetical protein
MWGYSLEENRRKPKTPRDGQAGFETDVFHIRTGLTQCDKSLSTRIIGPL